MHDAILPRSLFSIESDFVEKNPMLVIDYHEGDNYDPESEIKLFTNDKAGKSGRAKWYIANKDVITTGREHLNRWKVIVSSANAGGQKRSNQIAIVDNHSAFGRSRVALKTFATEQEAKNFFKYATSEDMGKLFDLEASGYFYTRLQNPTNDHVAAKIAALEGGSAAMLTSSGQAANFFALFNICECGSHIVSSSSIYGGTFNLIAVTMAKMGIEVTFVSPDCTEEELDGAFQDNTRAVFGESIANPALTVLDIEKFAEAAHRHGVPAPGCP